MARRKQEDSEVSRRKPATTPEAREAELINAAQQLAEEQIRGGTASSQVITHYLKLGSSREVLEQERIRHENELLQVKREQIAGQARIEELYFDAINAMRSYTGGSNQTDDDDEPE